MLLRTDTKIVFERGYKLLTNNKSLGTSEKYFINWHSLEKYLKLDVGLDDDCVEYLEQEDHLEIGNREFLVIGITIEGYL